MRSVEVTDGAGKCCHGQNLNALNAALGGPVEALREAGIIGPLLRLIAQIDARPCFRRVVRLVFAGIAECR